MKKLFRITDKDEKYPRGIKKEVLLQHFEGKEFAVDVYEDLLGKLFYKRNMNWGDLYETFIRLAPFNKDFGKLYFRATEFYLKADNDLHYVNSAYRDYDAWQKTIIADMPVDRQIFQAFAEGEWGYFNIRTAHENGVWCNVKLFAAENFKECDSLPDRFPIIGNKRVKGELQRDVRLGKLYIQPASIYL